MSMTRIRDMAISSLVAAEVPRTGEIIKNILNVFEREKTCYKMV